nr:putative ribonuclease H-like domain-containing protein [Tanacetum cinerariifolium]
MRPFSCLVIILNTLDSLGKFDEKVDERFFIGYSISSKAFRVFNSRTRIVQETLHINFLENKPNVTRSGPSWLFDIDTLTKSMNYQPASARNQPNSSPDDDATFEAKEPEFEVEKPESEVHISLSSGDKTKKHDDKTKREAKGKSPVKLSTGVRKLIEEFEYFTDNSTNKVNAASTSVSTVGESSYVDPFQYPDDPNMPSLEDITYFDDEENVGAEADFTNLETTITVSPISSTRIHRDHHVSQIIGDLSIGPLTRSMTRMVTDEGYTQEEGIDYEEVFALVARIKAIRLFLAYASFMGFMVYQMDVKSAFLYETIEEEDVCQPLGFKDPDYPNKVYKVVKELYGLNQALRAWYETLVNYLLENGFQRGKIDHTLFIKRVGMDGIREAFNKAYIYKAFFSSQLKFLIHTILQCMSAKRTAWNKFSSSMASAIICLSTGRKFNFSKYIFDILVRNVDSSSKFYMYPRFLQLMIRVQVGDLSSHTTKYSSPALTQKVFANMRRVGKGFSKVETSLFESMIVAQQADDVANEGAAGVNVDDVPAADAEPTIPSPPPTTQSPPKEQEQPSTSHVISTLPPSPNAPPPSPPQQQQPLQPSLDAQISMDLIQTLLETFIALTRRVENLEQDKISQTLEITKVETSEDTIMDDVLKQGEIIANMDEDEDVTLKDVAAVEKDAEVKKDVDVQGRPTESQAQIYKIDLEHADKVLSMQDDEPEPAELIEVSKEQLEEEESRALKRRAESSEEKAAEKQKLDEEIYTENNKPYYKIKRADGSHQLYLSFLGMLRNFDREDLEVLWKLVKERFKSSKPKNFSDDFLLTTLGAMFEKPDVQAHIWKSKRSVHGLAKVKSWKLLKSCGVQIITLTTTQLILLVERKYPLI